MNVSIIGSGVYAKAIAKILLFNGTSVTMWTESQDFKSILAPIGTALTNSYEKIAKNKIIFVLTSSNYVPDVLNGIKEFLEPDALLVLGSKGVLSDGTLMSELAKNILPNIHYAILSGPTFAVDIAALEPVGFTIATLDDEDYESIQKCMKSAYLEHSDDILGVELAGSLKNAYAIGNGILSGFEYGLSTSCLYMKRVLDEMTNILREYGASKSTANTLAGIGDLVLTCSSPNSRNYTFGSLLSLGTENQISEFLASHTVEGYENLKAFVPLFKKKKIDVPILECVFDIVEKNSSASSLVDTILKK